MAARHSAGCGGRIVESPLIGSALSKWWAFERVGQPRIMVDSGFGNPRVTPPSCTCPCVRLDEPNKVLTGLMRGRHGYVEWSIGRSVLPDIRSDLLDTFRARSLLIYVVLAVVACGCGCWAGSAVGSGGESGGW